MGAAERDDTFRYLYLFLSSLATRQYGIVLEKIILAVAIQSAEGEDGGRRAMISREDAREVGETGARSVGVGGLRRNRDSDARIHKIRP